ncbi:MAG: bifunctional riboflavin kinase/FAD synthetase [Bacillota bacterium]|nr:bifunctional riboflavin kinase/FAD synthetase [Bacillota bacterium]
MQIYSGLDCRIPACDRGVALGFFDGLHRGHSDLIRTLLYQCTTQGISAAAFTFDQHPESVLHPGRIFRYLDSLQERLDLMSGMGLDEVHVCSFDQQFAGLEPQIFLEEVIVRRLQAKLLVVGPDYRFGAKGSGDVALLRKWTRENGIQLNIVDEVNMGDDKVSSSRIRNLIQEGHVGQAASLLGRPYLLQGVVTAGRGLGRQLGFPTANILMPEDKVCPALGVYATRVRVVGRTWEAITSIGLRPTVSPDEKVPIIETYLYDADIPLYGESMSIELLAWIRPERQFRSLLQLSTQIKSDLDQVRLWHKQSEQCYEKVSIGGIPLMVLPSDRFAQSTLCLVFQTQATPRSLACNALLLQVLTATCRRYPDRTSLALALDNLYGATIDGSSEKSGDVQVLYLTAEALTRWTDESTPFLAVIDLIFDVLLDPDLAADGLFQEQVVETERNNLIMALIARENDRSKQAYDRCLEAFCGGQVHGLHATGKIEDLRNISREELGDAWRQLIGGMNLTVWLGGRIDDACLDLCCRSMARLPESTRPRLYPGRLPTPWRTNEKRNLKDQKEIEQARIVLAYDGLPPYYSHRLTAFQLLNSMLGGDVHSLLFDVIREKMGLAYQVFSLSQRYLSALFVLAGVAPDAVEPALAAIQEQVDNIVNGHFDDQLMVRAKSMLESAVLALYDDLSGMLGAQISGRLSGRLYSREDALLLLGAVTREQIMQCAADLRLMTSYVLTSGQAAGTEEGPVIG